MPNLVPIEKIENRIFQIRGKRVMLDRDLAELYSVSTKVLNQAVKRNLKRFPENFMFKLTTIEKREVVTNCDHLKVLKFSPQLPYTFTEQGVAQFKVVFRALKKLLEPPPVEEKRKKIGFHKD